MEVNRMSLNNSQPSSSGEQVRPEPSVVTAAEDAHGVHNAIMVNKQLLDAAREALRDRLPEDHRLPDTREIVDWCVRETGDYVVGAYSTLVRKSFYKWFDSDVARFVQSRDDIADKGRFVDACIIAAVFGEAEFRDLCRSIKVARLPTLSADEKARIKQSAAESAALEGEEVGVRPAPSFPGIGTP